MDYSRALQKLSQHANSPEGASFTLALLRAERQGVAPTLRDSFDDILACLEVVNHALNTPRPSENINGKADAFPRLLVADVSSILSEGWNWYWCRASREQFTDTFRTELASLLVQIAIAWDAVLAGDIDDIREHVRLEFAARNQPT